MMKEQLLHLAKENLRKIEVEAMNLLENLFNDKTEQVLVINEYENIYAKAVASENEIVVFSTEDYLDKVNEYDEKEEWQDYLDNFVFGDTLTADVRYYLNEVEAVIDKMKKDTLKKIENLVGKVVEFSTIEEIATEFEVYKDEEFFEDEENCIDIVGYYDLDESNIESDIRIQFEEKDGKISIIKVESRL